MTGSQAPTAISFPTAHLALLLLMLLCIQENLHAQKLASGGSGNTTMVIGLKGSVIAWGSNRCGTLGDSTLIADVPYAEDAPVVVHCGKQYEGTDYLGERAGEKVTAVATGSGDQAIAITESGLVWGWGCPLNGRLGLGTTDTTTNRTTPFKVLKGEYNGADFLGDDPLNPAIAVAVGGMHTLALTRDGMVLAWGCGGSGQLGIGGRGNRYLPTRVLMGGYRGTKYLGDDPFNPIIAIAAGEDFSLALAKDGTVYSWGGNGNGRLGDGSVSARLAPVRVMKGEYPGDAFLGDNPLDPVTAISAGAHHAIVLTKDGMLYCWGDNIRGQLGNGSSGPGAAQIVPAKVLKGAYRGMTYLGENGSNPITAIAAGGGHSLALAEDGTLFAWGDNAHGQLGDGTAATMRSTPVQVRHGGYPGLAYLGDNRKAVVEQISAGIDYSVAMTSDTRVYAWGANGSSQLGDGSLLDQYTPVSVPVLAGLPNDQRLPVQLSNFTVAYQQNSILLKWSTASEVDSYGFYIERAVESDPRVDEDWEAVTFVDGQGTTTQPHDYSFTDRADMILRSQRSIIVLYRLRYVDRDGAFSYSEPLRLSLSRADTTSLAIPHTRLGQNYPNPFQGGTTIEYEIIEPSMVLIELYDPTGKKISTLVDNQQAAGSHTLQIDAHDLRPGTYYYKLTVGNYSALRRMILS